MIIEGIQGETYRITYQSGGLFPSLRGWWVQGWFRVDGIRRTFCWGLPFDSERSAIRAKRRLEKGKRL